MKEKINNLLEICEKSQEELKWWLREIMLTYYGKKKVKISPDYLYVKGTLPICLVAHLDTVHLQEPKKFLLDTKLHHLFSPTGIGGDDRCGVYIILELLKKGFRPSIIFCCDEEVGGLGAKAFTKVYSSISNINWFLEFDRRGKNDVVSYQDGNNELTNVFEQFGFKHSYGSFSDISILAPFYKISAVNISSGYYKAHTKDEYIALDDLDWIIEKAEQVLQSEYVNNKYVYEKYVYQPTAYDYYDYYGSGYYSHYMREYYKRQQYDCGYDDYSSDYHCCNLCGKYHSIKKLYSTQFGDICESCLNEMKMVWCNNCQMYVVDDIAGMCSCCGQLVEDVEDGRTN